MPNRIEDLVPHAGAMVLIEEVESWDETRIVCSTRSHRRPDNPLLTPKGLPAAAGVELGAQVMAIHGALLQGGKPRDGLLVLVTDLHLGVRRLDDLEGTLRIRAELLRGHGRGCLYSLAIEAGGTEIMTGRITAMLDAV